MGIAFFERRAIRRRNTGLAALFVIALAGCTSATPPSPVSEAADGGASTQTVRVPLDGSQTAPDQPQSNSDSRATDQPTKRPLAELDNEVLATVLDDLPAQHGGKTIFARKAATYPQTIEKVLYRHKKEAWEILTEVQIGAFTEAAGQLVVRIDDKFLFESLKPHNERIQILENAAEKPEERSRRDILNRPVQAWPPGYSKDERFAVVRLVIPWSIHHAEATYLLSEEDGKWSVCLRQTVYYP